MNTKILVISALLITSLMAWPFNAQAGFWDIFDPLGISKAFPKTENKKYQILPEESQAYFTAFLPPATPKTYNPKRIYVVSATGYSSTPDQTDHTPFITASGIHVREGVAAANFLPFGTAFKIPEIFGDKIFVVEDRMNRRYWFNIDIWFPERGMAKQFGVRKVRIEIVS